MAPVEDHPRIAIKRSSIKTAGQINEGGLADIYDAFDREGNRVVFRELKPALRFKLRLRRCFVTGIGVRRQLTGSPHIVQYLGEGGGLRPFEVIEYLPCSSLKQLIYRKDTVLKTHPVCILQQVADALAAVHEAGYLHLDVKPENVLVVSGRERPLVKLTDFDLCQPIGSKTVPKNFGGSVAYLPPEYLSRKEVSISTDMFAFGVLAYNLFTFQMPFVGSVQTNMQSGTYEVKFPVTQEHTLNETAMDFIRRCLAQQVIHRFCDDNELRIGLKKLARSYGMETEAQ